MTSIAFGTIVTKVVMKNGNEAMKIEETTESVQINDRKQMLDHIFEQLDLLKKTDQVTFTIHNDKHSHEPCRMEITKVVKH